MKEVIFLIVIFLFFFNSTHAVNSIVVVNEEAEEICSESIVITNVKTTENDMTEYDSDGYLPWQSKKSKKNALKNRKNGTPNGSGSNLTKWQRSKLYYKLKAKKAMKGSSYNKAKSPKNKKKNLKKTIKKNRKSS